MPGLAKSLMWLQTSPNLLDWQKRTLAYPVPYNQLEITETKEYKYNNNAHKIPHFNTRGIKQRYNTQMQTLLGFNGGVGFICFE
jgi:hypothetical protein